MIAKEYVLKHPLDRPDITYLKAFRNTAIYLLITIVIAAISYYLFEWLGFFCFLPYGLDLIYAEKPTGFCLLYYFFCFFLSALLMVRKAAIGAIHLYQHYASETVRRRCLFKPTCSEYAVLAIRKYGVIIGCIKIYFRLFKRCRGTIYSIDYP